MRELKLAVLGGDGRQKYLISALGEMGYTVSAYGVNDGSVPNCDTLAAALDGAYAAVLPFPLTPDGVFLNASCETCNVRLTDLFYEMSAQGIKTAFGGGVKDGVLKIAQTCGVTLTDYGKDENVLVKNALCTAEGAIEIALRELTVNLHGSASAVIGYGRIGSLITSRLKALGSAVTVIARREESLSLAECNGAKAVSLSAFTDAPEKYDVIFNTVPTPLLNKNVLGRLCADTLIIDLASAPGGVDRAEAEALGLKVIWALSLPGKTSPQSAALIIAEAVDKRIRAERYGL